MDSMIYFFTMFIMNGLFVLVPYSLIKLALSHFITDQKSRIISSGCISLMIMLILIVFLNIPLVSNLLTSIASAIIIGIIDFKRMITREDESKRKPRTISLKNVAFNGTFAVGSIFYLILGIIGAIIHLWTILIAFGSSGFIAALITLVAPVASQFYWAFYAFKTTHTIFNTYWIVLATYIAAWIIMIVMYFIASILSSNKENE